ncbi:magnesium transporter spict [Arctopsyche grandis]|uniref:magnesium transporter spict n=1 Tax=Arctopsyche grandis TaxID=121162 RepID=UPI00406D85DA
MDVGKTPHNNYNSHSFAIGLCLAICSSFFIGTSFIIKKIGLRRLTNLGYARAGAGGFRYLREWIWWLGLIIMGIGEAFNFIAYAFAPASLVTPLGALSVLISSILASKFLNEKLNFLGKLGCFLCVIGSTIIVIHSPKQEEIETLAELQIKLQEPLFIAYLILIVFTFFGVVFYLGPKYGNSNIVVYLLLCSAVGSLTVVFCKGLGVSLRETFSGATNDFNNWVLWFLLIATVFCIMMQMNYLNKSLDIFNTSIVTPVYYVMFTTLVIIASAILFKEWQNMGYNDILGNICGFVVVIIGILLLNAFKDMDISFKDSSFNFKPKLPNNIENRTEFVYGTYNNRNA